MFGLYPDLTSYATIIKLQQENAKLQCELDRLKVENDWLKVAKALGTTQILWTSASTPTPDAADHKKILQIEGRLASLEAWRKG